MELWKRGPCFCRCGESRAPVGRPTFSSGHLVAEAKRRFADDKALLKVQIGRGAEAARFYAAVCSAPDCGFTECFCRRTCAEALGWRRGPRGWRCHACRRLGGHEEGPGADEGAGEPARDDERAGLTPEGVVAGDS
jgi:hypothetical protein